MTAQRDNSTLWVAAVCLAAALAGFLALWSGCASQVRPECPLGSRPVKVDTSSGTDGSVNATGSLPSQSVTAGGSWKGSASADWTCSPICARGQLLQASEDGKVRTVHCLPERCPDGGPR